MTNPHADDDGAIRVMLVSDSAYASYLATTIASILTNAAPDDKLSFHIVDGGLSPEDREKIASLREIREFDAQYYTVDAGQYADVVATKIARYPAIVYYRLLAPFFLPEFFDRILYMDVDVAVLGSLRELWNAPLGDNFIGAVADRDMRLSHRRELGLSDDYAYFNSGVLLMNLAKQRSEDTPREIFESVAELREKLDFPDQDALNIYAAKHGYCLLAPKWNTHPNYYVEGETQILHYMGTRHRCPHKEILCSYAALTPWRTLPFQNTAYRLNLEFRRFVCNFLCFFFFPRPWRRAIRKRFKLR